MIFKKGRHSALGIGRGNRLRVRNKTGGRSGGGQDGAVKVETLMTSSPLQRVLQVSFKGQAFKARTRPSSLGWSALSPVRRPLGGICNPWVRMLRGHTARGPEAARSASYISLHLPAPLLSNARAAAFHHQTDTGNRAPAPQGRVAFLLTLPWDTSTLLALPSRLALFRPLRWREPSYDSCAACLMCSRAPFRPFQSLCSQPRRCPATGGSRACAGHRVAGLWSRACAPRRHGRGRRARGARA